MAKAVTMTSFCLTQGDVRVNVCSLVSSSSLSFLVCSSLINKMCGEK